MKLLVLVAFLVSPAAYGKVSLEGTRPVPLPETPSTEWTSADVGKIIPLNLKDEMPNEEVVSRVGDHAFQNWLKSPVGKASSVARTAHTVQNTMRTEMAWEKHKFAFQVLAFQGVSQLRYTGWLNAELNFSSSKTNFEISEKIWKNKRFVISHSADNVQDLSSVGLRWNW